MSIVSSNRKLRGAAREVAVYGAWSLPLIPSKADLHAMLAEAVSNTAKLETPKETTSAA